MLTNYIHPICITPVRIFAPMSKKHFVFLVWFIVAGLQTLAQGNPSLNLAFYNLENLFDTLDNSQSLDEDFLPSGIYQWNSLRYANKLNNMSKVIGSINKNEGPDILGVCEVENKAVLTDLISREVLKPYSYEIIHRESPDERGIDVALLYNKKKLKALHQEWISPDIGSDKTREVLFARLQSVKGKNFWVVVVHAPSRREGKEISEAKRLSVSESVCTHIKILQGKYPQESFFLMGDFNDEPSDSSMSLYSSIGFVNAMKPIQNDSIGTLKYGNQWFIFDQILYANQTSLKADSGSVQIFAPEWLKQHGEPKYEGSPLRTFGGKKYLNGYSDHFPVSIQIY